MAEQAVFTTEKGNSVWIQPDGPGTRSYYLGCHDVDDFDEDEGAITLLQCISRLETGGFDTVGFTTAPPTPIDITLSTFVGKTLDWLEKVDCPFTLYILLQCGGRKDVFTNYDRVLALNIAKRTTTSRTGWVMSQEDIDSRHAFTVQALPPSTTFLRLTGARQEVSETQAINDLAFCNEKRCAGPCGSAQDICQDGIAGTDAADASTAANALMTADGGIDGWPASAADPFGNGEDISSVVCFQSSNAQDVTRKVAARGTTDVANPAEVAITEDDGATWTAVNVGSTNGQFVPNDNSVFALNGFNIWLGTDDGFIYFSSDNGDSWTAQTSGGLTAANINAIHFADENVGFAGAVGDVVLKTIDGGDTWTIATSTGNGGDIEAIFAIDNNIVFATTDDGELFRSDDGAVTWTEVTGWSGSGTGSLDDIDFANNLVGVMIHNTAAPVGTALVTFDGGYIWEPLTTPTNAGLNTVWMCGTDLFYVAGEVQGGTAFVAKFTVPVG